MQQRIIVMMRPLQSMKSIVVQKRLEVPELQMIPEIWKMARHCQKMLRLPKTGGS